MTAHIDNTATEITAQLDEWRATWTRGSTDRPHRVEISDGSRNKTGEGASLMLACYDTNMNGGPRALDIYDALDSALVASWRPGES